VQSEKKRLHCDKLVIKKHNITKILNKKGEKRNYEEVQDELGPCSID
jgi:hypothetical protein